MIKTKFHRPAIDNNFVQRPGLISRLNEGLSKRATIISAPAGYGKTTLSVQWLEKSSSKRSAWLSLDKNDSELEHFLRYVIAALHTVVPGLCTAVEELLSAFTLPPPDYLADAMIAALAELEDPILLVLDDYHTIASKEVHGIISRIVQHVPDNFHLVLLTRIDPPLPVGLWRVREWLTELRAADLRFTRAEAETFLCHESEVSLSPKAVDIIMERTEGWFAGLQLFRLSMAGADDPEQFARDFSASDRLLVDFLMSEVMAQQPPEIQDFLRKSSLFERFCAPLCDFVLREGSNSAKSHEIIARLERNNLFIVPLDSERYWYRYHHLFQELLAQEAKQLFAQEHMTHLHQRAGEWFAAQKLAEEALRHFLAAGELDNAAALVENNLHALIDDDLSRRELARWLAMFPSSAVEQRPGLLIAHAYERLIHWDIAGVLSMLDRAETLSKAPQSAIPDQRRNAWQGDIDVLSGFCLFWQGNIQRALRHSLQALETVPREHRYAHKQAILYTAGAYALSGKQKSGLQVLAKALAEDHVIGSRNAGHLLHAQAAIYLYAGNLEGVEQSINQMLTIHETVPVPDYWYGYAHYFHGIVAYERNHLDIAAEYLTRLEQLRHRVTPRLYHEGLIGLALIAQGRGDIFRARRYASAARAHAVEFRDAYSNKLSDSFEIRLSMLRGEVPAAHLTAPTGLDSNNFWLEVPSLTHAEVLIRQQTAKCSQETLRYIDEAIHQAENHHNARQVMQFLTVKALALAKADEQDAALQVLERALRMAEPQGFIRTFLDRGQLMADLLDTYLERNPDDHYAGKLLTAFDQEEARKNGAVAWPAESPHANMPANTVLPEALTNRETDVLLLLEQRLSNKEIADRLFISPETVKQHTAHIYKKLNVNSRRAAVAAAKMLGLQFPSH